MNDPTILDIPSDRLQQRVGLEEFHVWHSPLRDEVCVADQYLSAATLSVNSQSNASCNVTSMPVVSNRHKLSKPQQQTRGGNPQSRANPQSRHNQSHNTMLRVSFLPPIRLQLA
jgi:hypothetical protein